MSPEQHPQPSISEQPFAEFVTKTANGCNMQPLHETERDPLALTQPGCDHCYMYTHSTAWRDEPEFMELEVLEQTAFRIAEHAETHRLPHVRIIAHGGEPLLILRKDPDYYSKYSEIMHRHIDPTGAKTHLYMQTNGLLLTQRKGPEIIKQLKDADFNIGLSIDGNQAANDLHRRDKAGRSTHSRAERAAHLLHEAGANWGVLGVIDPRTEPEEVVEYLAGLQPPVINLFLMHANNSEPPIEYPGAISLGEWQKRALDYYINWAQNHPGATEPPFEMPIYDNYLRMAFGAPSLNDTAGARVTQELFITPSGKWERLDTLKSADDGAVFTGRNIFEHSLDDVRRDPGIVARRMGLTALAPECQGCDVLNLCFGGHYPNRYKRPDEPLSPQSSVEQFVEAFRNPSGHCKDHKIFLHHVKELVGNVAEEPTPANNSLILEDLDIIEVPDNANEIAEAIPLPLDKLLKPFRIAAYHHNNRRQEQAQNFTLGIVATPRLAYYDTAERPRLGRDQVNALRQGIYGRHVTGRIALGQLQAISEQYDQGRIVYYGLESGESLTVDMHLRLSKDYNDAIVNSILSNNENRLDDATKVGGYWFIGRNIIESLLADPLSHSGSVVTFRRGEDWRPDPFINGENGIDYWKLLTTASKPDVIHVSAFDLPGDVLVVDPRTQNSSDITTVIDDIKNSYSQYDDARALAAALQTKGIHIEPLLGAWPQNASWNGVSSGIAHSTLPEVEVSSNTPSKPSYRVPHSNGSYYGGTHGRFTLEEKATWHSR